MARVTIEVPDGLTAEMAKRIATDALRVRVVAGRVEDVLSRSETSTGVGLLAQLALHDETWREIETRWGLLASDEVAAATGGNRDNARAHTANLRRRKGLAGVKRGGRTVYPAFQLTTTAAGPAEVAPAWTAVVEALAPAGWEQADILMWAASPNAWLQGGTPADEIRQHPAEPTDRLLVAAQKALPDGVRGTHVA